MNALSGHSNPAGVLTDDAWASAQRLVHTMLGASIQPLDGAAPKYIGIRSRVARVRLIGSGNGWETLIVKQRYIAAGPPYDPSDPAPGSLSTRVAYEAAALRFLGDRGRRRLAPQLIGVDYNRGVLVMEDIGEGRGLLEHLLGNDSLQADDALRSYATAMGELHAAGADRADEFGAILGQFGSRPIGPAAVAEHVAEFEQAMHASGMTIPPDVRRYLEHAIARMRAPEEFLTLTHGDICPGHDRIINGHSIFIDLELAGYRHAFRDLAYLYVPFPFCGFVGRLPRQSQAQAVAAYRVAASQTIPAIADDERFHAELAYAWLFWLIRNVGVLLPHARQQDSAWGTTSFRQRLIQQCEDFAAFPYNRHRNPAVADWMTSIAADLRSAWPKTPPLPPYPAYDGNK